MTGRTQNFVAVQGVTRVFDGCLAADDISLDVREGEFLSLLGPSGCGKTTLLRIVAGLEFPDRGRILIDGRDVTRLSANKRPTNLVFQRVTLFPHLSVAENIAFGLKLQRLGGAEVRARVAEALETVRLPGFGSRRPETLSGGEAQRVALARALVNRPKVLLFDEPLSALDLKIRRALQVELRDIHRELGTTFVYVTHDQEEAMTMSDRIAVMDSGQLLQEGSPVELYRAPASLFVAQFVGSSNIWPGVIDQVGRDDALIDAGGHLIKVPRPPWAAPGARAWVMLRPECLTLRPGRGGENGPTTLAGHVDDARFVGPVIDYRVTVGQKKLAVSTHAANQELLAVGQQVTVHWRPGDAVVLPDEQQARQPAEGSDEAATPSSTEGEDDPTSRLSGSSA